MRGTKRKPISSPCPSRQLAQNISPEAESPTRETERDGARRLDLLMGTVRRVDEHPARVHFVAPRGQRKLRGNLCDALPRTCWLNLRERDVPHTQALLRSSKGNGVNLIQPTGFETQASHLLRPLTDLQHQCVCELEVIINVATDPAFLMAFMPSSFLFQLLLHEAKFSQFSGGRSSRLPSGLHLDTNGAPFRFCTALIYLDTLPQPSGDGATVFPCAQNEARSLGGRRGPAGVSAVKILTTWVAMFFVFLVSICGSPKRPLVSPPRRFLRESACEGPTPDNVLRATDW